MITKVKKKIERCQNEHCTNPLKGSQARMGQKKICRQCWDARKWSGDRKCKSCNRPINKNNPTGYCYIHSPKWQGLFGK